MEKHYFNGFPKQMFRFYSLLAQNNNKEWFLSHKNEYEKYVVQPSCAFIIAMGTKLKKISRKIHAIPRINKSLFRIHRDMRFSEPESPYKINLGILFWEGTEKRRIRNPGFYFHIEKRTLILSTGVYEFPPVLLKKYRDKLTNVSVCRELKRVLNKISKSDHIMVRGKRIKTFPPGYTIHPENEELIKYRGIHALYKTKIPDILYDPGLIDFCYEKYSHMAPLHRWIMKL